MQLQFRALPAFVIAEPLVSVVGRVPIEVKHRPVKSVGAAPRRNDHVRAAIAALFRGGAQRDGAELLDIVGIQPLDIALWIGHRGLIGVNAVNRDVMSAVAGSSSAAQRQAPASAGRADCVR